MDNSARDPVSVESKVVHGPSFGMGGISLVALASFGIGLVAGGVVIPYLRASGVTPAETAQAEAAEAARGAILLSIGQQTVYAAPLAGSPPVPTGVSVEQLLSEIEVGAAQSGLSTSVSLNKGEGTFEIAFVFSDTQGGKASAFPGTKARGTHPKSKSLMFVPGVDSGSIILKTMRTEGRTVPAGQSFVEIVAYSGLTPTLPEGQLLTRRGVFEVRPEGGTVSAWLDGTRVWPALPSPAQASPPAASPPGAAPSTAPNLAQAASLAVQSALPEAGLYRERLVLVATAPGGGRCTARAIILDTVRGTVLELPEPLEDSRVAVDVTRSALTLSGFCVQGPSATPATPPPKAGPDAAPASVAPMLVRLDAVYSIADGVLSWRRVALPAPPPPIAAPAPIAEAASPWRQTTPTRIASPLVPGGALVSVACRPGGGQSIAVSGLPAPASGDSAPVGFAAAGTSVTARMRWRAAVNGYETDTISRPQEANAILGRLKAAGALTVSQGGVVKPVANAGRARIERLAADCAASPPPVKAAPSPQAAKAAPTPKPKPVAPATPAPPKPKAAAVPAPKAAPKPAAKPAPRPEPAPAER